ncbi:MAG: hypothetical protein ACI8RD_004865 [Bacillariaceae sp.]|jgi:hypothetical protein
MEFSMVFSTVVLIESVEIPVPHSGSHHVQVIILIKMNIFEKQSHYTTPYNNVRNLCKKIVFKCSVEKNIPICINGFIKINHIRKNN